MDALHMWLTLPRKITPRSSLPPLSEQEYALNRGDCSQSAKNIFLESSREPCQGLELARRERQKRCLEMAKSGAQSNGA